MQRHQNQLKGGEEGNKIIIDWHYKEYFYIDFCGRFSKTVIVTTTCRKHIEHALVGAFFE